METVVNSKVLQLTATMAQTVIHKRMAWYVQLVGLVLRMVVAKQPGNSRLGMVGLVRDNLTHLVVEQPGSSLGVAPEGMALAEFMHQQVRWCATDVVMLAT